MAQDTSKDSSLDANKLALVETRRRQLEDTESKEHESSGGEKKLMTELMAVYDKDDKEHSLRTLSTPDIPPFAVKVTLMNMNNEINSEKGFEGHFHPVSMSVASVTAEPALQAPTQTSHKNQLEKESGTQNFDGLPGNRDADGIEIGYKESSTVKHTYAWLSDTAISNQDPYSAKGCLRRMIFESDAVPSHEQYKIQDPQFNKPRYLSAVDKAFEWNRTRRGVNGATEETLKDGKLPRHFVLRMGSPNGFYGDASRVAERLKSLVKHFFYVRLAKSHLTLEIDIPYIALAGSSYFEKYIDQVRQVMEDTKMRSRLTVQLAPDSAQRYIDCEPECFQPPSIDHELKWHSKVKTDRHFVFALLQHARTKMPEDYRPSPCDFERAKQIFLKGSMVTEAEQQNRAVEAVRHIKEFVYFVHNYESLKSGMQQQVPPNESLSAPAVAYVPVLPSGLAVGSLQDSPLAPSDSALGKRSGDDSSDRYRDKRAKR